MKRCAYLFTLFTASLAARGSGNIFEFFDGAPSSIDRPWMTGPLLTPSGHVVPDGHQNYEPYIYWTQTNGSYNPHWNSTSGPTLTNVLTLFSMQIGVAPNTEIDLNPQIVYNNMHKQHMWRISDFPIALAWQLVAHSYGKWYPALKFRVGVNVPFGKYDRLQPEKFGVDAGGVGNWQPNIAFVFTKLHHIRGHQFFAWRFSPQYTFPTSFSVKDVSIYGGAKGTRGKVHAGSQFFALLGMEYSLSQNWVLALDVQYSHLNSLRFKGKTPPGTKPAAPSKEQFSLAPGIEYNWSSNLGIIVGPWFSVAGRNSARFMSYVFAINIYN